MTKLRLAYTLAAATRATMRNAGFDDPPFLLPLFLFPLFPIFGRMLRVGNTLQIGGKFLSEVADLKDC